MQQVVPVVNPSSSCGNMFIFTKNSPRTFLLLLKFISRDWQTEASFSLLNYET